MVDFYGGGEVAGVLPHPGESNGAGSGGGDSGFASMAIIAIGEDCSEETKIAFVVGSGEESYEGGTVLVGFADFVGEPIARAGGFDGKGGVPGSGECGEFNHGSKVANLGDIVKILFYNKRGHRP